MYRKKKNLAIACAVAAAASLLSSSALASDTETGTELMTEALSENGTEAAKKAESEAESDKENTTEDASQSENDKEAMSEASSEVESTTEATSEKTSEAGTENASSATALSEESVTYSYSTGLTENGFFEGIKAADYVTLPEYKGISVSADILTADQAAVDEQIQLILKTYATYDQVTDRAVEDGDTVNIDYVGHLETADGETFSGGNTNGSGTEVTIGVTQYIDDFLEQIIGHTPGETFNVEVTFPENYGVENLNGKDAVFVTTVNYIRGEEHIPSEITDEVASDNGFDTPEELTADIEKWVINKQKSPIVSELLAQAEISEIPESVLAFYQNGDLAYAAENAVYNGMNVEDYIIASTGYATMDEFFESRRETYEKLAKTALTVQAIAELEGLTVSEQDYIDSGVSDFDRYAEFYGAGYVNMTVLNSTISKFIFDNAVIE